MALLGAFRDSEGKGGLGLILTHHRSALTNPISPPMS